jgi:hypothetical protein
MSKAIYHSNGKRTELDVLKVHKDQTVDLGRDGKVIVSNCTVAEHPEDGQASLVQAAGGKKTKKQAAAPEPAGDDPGAGSGDNTGEGDGDPAGGSEEESGEGA